MNSMLERDRAIVTNIPGTTRDTLDEALVHKGFSITLVDTAGMRDLDITSGADMIESIGVERSRRAINGADFCALVVDSSRPLSGEDIVSAKAALEKPAILVANKSDLPRLVSGDELDSLGSFLARVGVSAMTGEGVSDLKDVIREAALGNASTSDAMMATERMVGALEDASKCLRDAVIAIDESYGADVAGSLLSEAAEYIASVLGADASEELLDAIFSTFCVGK
jgi:tRNA modification GTPase